MQSKLLIDRTKKMTYKSIFCYLHMYANNKYRYFSTALRGAPKSFFIRSNSCTSSSFPPETRAFLDKSHPIRPTLVLRLLHSPHIRFSLKNSSPARPQSRTRGLHISDSNDTDERKTTDKCK